MALRKKWMAMLLIGVMVIAVISGCASNTNNNSASTNNNTPAASNSTDTTPAVKEEEPAKPVEYVDIEVWTTNSGYREVTKGSPLYDFYKEKTGVGIIQPYVEWNGGTTYQQQLNLKIAANEMPDMFLPVNGMEYELAKNGALLDLTDLLPEKAPRLWNLIPQDVWDVVRSYDPNGEGRIYSVPSILSFGRTGPMIRQDWLDTLNLSMPTTQEEFVNVLRAFRDKDPNQNGLKDELPTGGREQARWMDYLFSMYGIAMHEGYPDWDIYNGELTYSAVSPNMKDAIAFLRDLYKERLIDPETFLNSKSAWEGKVSSNQVGVFFYWVSSASGFLADIYESTGIKGDFSVLPQIDAPGYEGFTTMKRINSQQWVVKNTNDQAKIDSVMKLLDSYADESQWIDMWMGVEGMHWETKDGLKVKMSEDKSVMQNLLLTPYYDIGTVQFSKDLYADNPDPEWEWANSQDIRNLVENQKYVKALAGDGLPAAVYSDYPDIQNRTLYVEYITKIVLGDYDLDKFDEFVDRWYSSGGEAVTKAAREWYAKTQQ